MNHHYNILISLIISTLGILTPIKCLCQGKVILNNLITKPVNHNFKDYNLTFINESASTQEQQSLKKTEDEIRFDLFDGIDSLDLKKCKLMAEKGNAEAQYRYACALMKNETEINGNREESISWLLKSAEQNYADAQYTLGKIYCWGWHNFGNATRFKVIGGDTDFSLAYDWFLKAAEQSHQKALLELANMYKMGWGVKHNHKQMIMLLKQSANLGNLSAQRQLGDIYNPYRKHLSEVDKSLIPKERLDSIYSKQNCELAIFWYTKAAKQGDMHSQLELAQYYHYGRGIDRDYVQSAIWYEKAAKQGSAYAKYVLGKMYAEGNGVPKNPKKAIEYLKSSDYQQSELYLAKLYCEGVIVPQNLEEGIRIFQKNGPRNPEAAYALSHFYLEGIGVERNYERAFYWISMAAHHEFSVRDNPCNYYRQLGNYYYNGIGVEQSDSEAIKWYLKAADKSDSKSMYCLGYVYFNQGKNIDNRYFDDAFKWFYKGAIYNQSDAQTCLGHMYADGYGVKKDKKKAMEWYLKAAGNHNLNAEYSIGLAYHTGTLVKKNYSEAIKWYTLAANEGDSFAQNNLGSMYYKGQGCQPNMELAKKWWTLSSEQGNSAATTNLKLLN